MIYRSIVRSMAGVIVVAAMTACNDEPASQPDLAAQKRSVSTGPPENKAQPEPSVVAVSARQHDPDGAFLLKPRAKVGSEKYVDGTLRDYVWLTVRSETVDPSDAHRFFTAVVLLSDGSRITCVEEAPGRDWVERGRYEERQLRCPDPVDPTQVQSVTVMSPF